MVVWEFFESSLLTKVICLVVQTNILGESLLALELNDNSKTKRVALLNAMEHERRVFLPINWL